MYIVHLYSLQIPELAQYVSLLTTLTGVESDSVDQPKALAQLFATRQPDIVHLHGCSADHVKAALWARQHGARIVLSPHGELEPWRLSAKVLKQRQNGAQKLATHAYCLIARSPIEADSLSQQAWCPRIETVPNPLITRTTTTEHLLSEHARIYQQVMDSNVLQLMDEPTLRALHILLKVGITGDEHWAPSFDATAVNWRLMLIYARHEGILHFIQKGCFAKGITPPSSTLKQEGTWGERIASYLPTDYHAPVQLSGQPLDLVRTIQQQSADGSLSLRSLADLDQALRADDLEEDLLMQLLTAEKLDTFLASLLPVMSEQTGLDEGFMPCTPLNNRQTQRLRNVIKKHLQI